MSIDELTVTTDTRGSTAPELRRVDVVTVGSVLDQRRLSIPRYQRPYSWTPATALQLLDDIHDAFTTTGAPSYVLGALILHRHGDDRLDVIDGQQRLLTLLMIVQLLDGRHDGKVLPSEAPTSPVVLVRTQLAARIRKIDKRQALKEYIRSSCWLVQVQTDDADEAFRVFDSQNYRGKPLLPHDLLKAHHLRAMQDESEAMQSAVVEGWERIPDDQLDRLFSAYLYRIRQWSNGLPARRFTVRDIDLFKGISPHGVASPADRYHLAAQAAVPMLAAWNRTQSGAGDEAAAAIRDAQRARFQLDAPVTAGRAFFDMVAFMDEELRRLRKEHYPPEHDDFASTDADFRERSGKSRFRYVSELFLAAVLQCTNKFGDKDIDEHRDRLFHWAYFLRVTKARVQFASVDNRAREAGSAFAITKAASRPRELRRLVLTPATPASDPDTDPTLTASLRIIEGGHHD
ncbi:DUF262 domain-containing protein [Aquipuribacter hungaricus]|uniref:DUF262 domain-containing protein n=1 Tax=Aquipuribacter hungaricus TaxID=545624 RepID=A0ABV7WI30_9MICO